METKVMGNRENRPRRPYYLFLSYNIDKLGLKQLLNQARALSNRKTFCSTFALATILVTIFLCSHPHLKACD